MGRCFCLAALLAIGGSPSLFAQSKDTVATGSQVVRSERVPNGEVRGIVIDAVTSKPLDSVFVALEGTQRLTLTDSAGQFRLGGIEGNGTEYVLLAYDAATRIEKVAFKTRQMREGWAARVRLSPAAKQCEITSFGVRAVVSDALTGLAPTSQVVLRASHGSAQAWGFNERQPPDTAVAVSAYFAVRQLAPVVRPDGPLEIDVVAPGYAPWRLSDFPVKFDECGTPSLDSFRVWLLPQDAVGQESPWTGTQAGFCADSL